MFWLKKVISFWLMPLPFCLGVFAVGFLMGILSKRSRLGRRLQLAAAALLLAFSNRFVGTGLLSRLEARYPAVPEAAAGREAPDGLSACGFVVVLGSGNSDFPGIPATSRLSTSGLGRIVEAVRVLGMLPGARLILSGPSSPGHPSHATVLAQAAASLGVSPGRVILVETARDTEDESHAVARIVGQGRVALVTSAWHMPRAAALFRRAGVDIVPCPADFVAGPGFPPIWSVLSFDSPSLEKSTLAVHEWLGILWLKIRGVS